jgi:four helix bundle protein
VSKLSDSEGEAAETQTWLDFALECQYFEIEKYKNLFEKYDNIIGTLVHMSLHPENWSF